MIKTSGKTSMGVKPLVFCLKNSGLSFALREVPLGAGYAVWVAVGAVTTVIFAMATGAESISWVKIIFLLMIIGGVIGLKVSH